MIVGSELKEALLENKPNTELCVDRGHVSYDTSNAAVAVGDGAVRKYILTTEHPTQGDYLASIYPIGTMLYNMLDTGDFNTEMGNTAWVNIGEQTQTADGKYVAISKDTDLGALLETRGWDDWDGDPTHIKMLSPTGRYLRAAGNDQMNNTLAPNTSQTNQLKKHNHTTNASPRSGFHRSGAEQGYSSGDGHVNNTVTATIYNAGTVDESRPETLVLSLYLKVNK